MSLAAETRDAVRDRPFLFDALRAGVVNYAAAARELAVAEDTEAVATALRRFAADLPAPDRSGDARVTMHGGLDRSAEGGDALLSLGESAYTAGTGQLTGVQAAGEVDAGALEAALGLLRTHDVPVEAAGIASGSLVVIVDRADAATAVRLVERAIEGGPTV